MVVGKSDSQGEASKTPKVEVSRRVQTGRKRNGEVAVDQKPKRKEEMRKEGSSKEYPRRWGSDWNDVSKTMVSLEKIR